MEIILNMDKNIILQINEILPNYPMIIDIFRLITTLGNAGAIWIFLGAFFSIKKKTRIYGLLMLFSLLIGTILGNLVLKNLFERSRPFLELGIPPFIIAPKGFSFPSGHSLSSFIGATSIWFINKKYGIIAYILAILIALSRVFLLVHYPTDIVAGAILGIIIAYIIFLCFIRIDKSNILNKQ